MGYALQGLLATLGLPQAEVFDLPVRSSDIHKVIEHMHGRLEQAFDSWFYFDPQPYPLSAYKGVVKNLFYHREGVASPAVIEGDVRTLPATLEAIAARGGGEIPKPLR